MKKYLFFILLINLFSFTTIAQNFHWAKAAGGSSDDFARGVATDNSGNVYTVGAFKGEVDFDPGPGTYNLLASRGSLYYNVFITKMNASGELVWAKNMGGDYDDLGMAVAVDDSDNVYVTGHFGVDSNFNLHNIFFIKLNTFGEVLWEKYLYGNGDNLAYGISTDHLGNIYITGLFRGTFDFNPGVGVDILTSSAGQNDIYIVKLTSSGEYVWVRKMGGNGNDVAYGITIDYLNNIYVTGEFTQTADFDPGTGSDSLHASGSDDIFIAKLTSDGNYVWAKCIGNYASDAGISITTDRMGNVYTTGLFRDTVDFDPGPGITNLLSAGSIDYSMFPPRYPSQDAFILKLTASGNFVWAKHMGGVYTEVGYGIITDDSGYVYTTGSFHDTLTFNTTNVADTLINIGVTAADVFLSKHDSLGNLVWGKRIGGEGIDYSLGIAVNEFNHIYVAGIFGKSVDFDPNAGVNILESKGGNDMFLVKLGGCVLPFTTQPVNKAVYVDSTATFTVAANDATFFQWQENKGAGFVNITNGAQYSGTNTPTLIITHAKLSQNNYAYRCIVKNINCADGGGCTDTVCTDVSNTVSLNVNCLLSAGTKTADQLIYAGNTAQFTITTSSAFVTYQWQENTGNGFSNIINGGQYAGANTNTLIISNVTRFQNGNNYRCILKDGICSETTSEANLYVNCNLSIVKQPTNQTENIGDTAKFITQTASPTATFQWQREYLSQYTNLYDTGQYSGVTNDTLTIKTVTVTKNKYNYRCVITDHGCVVNTNPVKLNLACNLSINTQPVNQSVSVAKEAQFITAASSKAASYQWQQDAGTGYANLTNTARFTGTNNDTLTISNVDTSLSNYSYRCIVSIDECNVTSNGAVLTIHPLTSINELTTENGFTIYPNPTTDIITIRINNLLIGASYVITDAKGVAVLKGKLTAITTVVDLSKLPVGTYNIQTDLTKQATYKIVKQ